jgi:hypothetical protein
LRFSVLPCRRFGPFFLFAARVLARKPGVPQHDVTSVRSVNVASTVALQVTSPTPEKFTDDQIEPETVGDKDRVHPPLTHPPPGIVHQDDSLEHEKTETFLVFDC